MPRLFPEQEKWSFQKKLSPLLDLCLFATARPVTSYADFESPASTSHDSVFFVCLETEFLKCTLSLPP